MITENISTLEIHKLTQAQYDRELENGTLQTNAIYLTPNEEENQNAFSKVTVGAEGLGFEATSPSDAFNIKGGEKISLSVDSSNKSITIDNTGVRSISQGSYNGTIKVNTNGTSVNVSVKGLGSAAYTDSSSYIPTTRTINGKALDSDITLSASDMGAATSDHAHNDKQDTITGAATSITNSNLTTKRALVSNSSGKVAVSAVTSTELGYLSGVTSGIQTQLDGKMNAANPTGTGSFSMNGASDGVVGQYSFASGLGTTASGLGSHAENLGTYAYGEGSHAEGGATNLASTICTNLTNTTTILTEWAASPFNLAYGKYSHTEGFNTLALGDWSHAEGCQTSATGMMAHSEGGNTTASGISSHAEGVQTTALGESSHAEGYKTTANQYQHVQGHYNKTTYQGVDSGTGTTTSSAFMIGNGTSDTPSNAFRVTYSGKAHGLSSFSGSGADYAEYFEWQDSNPNIEDRRGYFVTLDGDKIKIAEPNDYILGIISGLPSVIGNGDEDWMGKYLRDEFGSFVTEEFEYETSVPEEVQEDVVDEETGEIITKTKIVMKTVTKTGTRYKCNPDYDPSLEYIQREDRPEWDAVGILGVLSVRDDGTCEVNGYCKVAKGGIATASETGYRVIQRINNNIVKVILK